LAVGLGFAALVAASLLAGEIGGDRVSVFTATTAHQDPPQIQARPALIGRAARCEPRRLHRSGNSDRVDAG